MADAEEIASYCNELGITYIALTPNKRALERAILAKVPQIAVFIGASSAFNKRNINKSTAESLAECEEILQKQKLTICLFGLMYRWHFLVHIKDRYHFGM